MIHVLLVSVRADHGGGPKHIELLLENQSSNVEAHVACPDDPPYRSRFESLTGGRIFSMPHRRFTFSAALGLASYVHRHNIDVLHAHGKGAGVYARFVSLITGCPVLYTPHGLSFSNSNRLLQTSYWIFEKVSGRWLDHIVYVSAEERDVAAKARLWNRVTSNVIVNGVMDVTDQSVKLMRKDARCALGVSDNQTLVITLSRFDYQKNMSEALSVARLMPEIIFLWVGNGGDWAKLRNQAKRENVKNVRFIGAVDDPAPLLAASDLYLSTSRWEGLPVALLEAMAMGLPIIASDVVGHRELVRDCGAGVLFALGDPRRAAHQVRQLVADGEGRRILGARGRAAQREKYSASLMAQRVCDLYRQLQRPRGR